MIFHWVELPYLPNDDDDDDDDDDDGRGTYSITWDMNYTEGWYSPCTQRFEL